MAEESDNSASTKPEEPDQQTRAVALEVHETSPQGRYVKLETRLGAGAYKDVWRAYDTLEGIEVAWNVVKLSRIPPGERKRIKTEVKLLKDIEHKNIIKYHNSWVDREKQQIVFITEIMSSGSLKDYLRKNPMIRWSAVKRWCHQILDGLEFLHSRGIIHRDIKCDNIFINGSTGDLRIGDLGLSTKISEARAAISEDVAAEDKDREVTTSTMTCLGTPEFMAPELYDESYDELVDIYAFGMACLEMITSLTPYHECTSAPQIYKKVMNGEMPPELEIVSNISAKVFIEACLQRKDSRPSAAQLSTHEFLQANETDDFKLVRIKLRAETRIHLEGWEEHEGEEGDEEDVVVYHDGGVVTDGVRPAANNIEQQQDAVSPSGLAAKTVSGGGDKYLREKSGSFSPRANKHTNGEFSKGYHESLSPTDRNAAVIFANSSDILSPAIPSSDRNGPEEAEDVKRLTDKEKADGGVLVDSTLELDLIQSVLTTHSGVDEDRANSQGSVDPALHRSGSATFDGSGVQKASRIRRVHTRSGSATSADLSPRLDLSGDVSSAAIPASGPSQGEVGQFMPLEYDSFDSNRSRNAIELQYDDSGVQDEAKHRLSCTHVSSVSVFDIADIPGSTESIVFRMCIPVPQENSYKEVEFEFNLLSDDPVVLVDEMKTDAELASIIGHHAPNIVAVLTPVVILCRRIASDRLATGKVSTPLSDLIFSEILRIQAVQQTRGLSPSGGDWDPFCALVPSAKMRIETSNRSVVASSVTNNQSVAPHSNVATALDLPSSSSNDPLDDVVAESDIDKLLTPDPEYAELLAKYQDNLMKAEKEYSQRVGNLSAQKKKLDETFEKKQEEVTARSSDLNQQLQNMKEKFKERMNDFDNMRKDLLNRRKERKKLRRIAAGVTPEQAIKRTASESEA